MSDTPYTFGASEARVKVSAPQHDSGTVVIDIDAGSQADIDIDLDGETINIVRSGKPMWN